MKRWERFVDYVIGMLRGMWKKVIDYVIGGMKR